MNRSEWQSIGRIIIIAGVMFLIIAFLYCIVLAEFNNAQHSKQLISEFDSPDENYSIKAYRVGWFDPIIEYELNYNNGRKEPKEIYKNTESNSSDIEWINNDTVKIEGNEYMCLRALDRGKHQLST